MQERDARDPAQTADALDDLVPRLDAVGVTQEQLDELSASADSLRQNGGEINAARVEAQYRQILRQLEQLEIQIVNNSAADAVTLDSMVQQGEITDEAADYYRRLSEQPVRLQR